MRKLCFSLLALVVSLSVFAKGNSASISSTPSPIVSNKAFEVTINTSDLGSEVYFYTWCKFDGLPEKTPHSWSEVESDSFRMTGSGGVYSYKVSDIKTYYNLSDSELAQLVKIGFIAKTKNGSQTEDLFCDVVQGAREAYSGGDGTEASPFILKTAEDLIELSNTQGDWESDCYLKLEADLDASGLTSPIGEMTSPFKASFDGNGFSIKNLRLASGKFGNATGLFGVIEGGHISNLGVIGAEVSGQTYTGIIAGLLKSGTIERCFSTGNVSSGSICAGGLVGENIAGIIMNCYSGASVLNADDYASGGLVGKNSGSISNCYAAGEVVGHDYVGGIVGANYGTVSNSVAINAGVKCFNDFTARLGGHNNSRNISQNNYSWADIPAVQETWTGFGDHATSRDASVLGVENSFKSLVPWDFNNVWEWKWAADDKRGYPLLRNLNNQRAVVPDSFLFFDVAVENVSEEKTVSVGPNPTEGMLFVSSLIPVDSYIITGLNGCVHLKGFPNAVHSFEIDMTGLDSGLYILRMLNSEGSVSIQKIIKK